MKETKKFRVEFKSLKLHGFRAENEETVQNNKSVAIEIKWKGYQKKPSFLSVAFYGKSKSTLQKNLTTGKIFNVGEETVAWDDVFPCICEFYVGENDEASVDFWDTKFYVLFGDITKSQTKMVGLGKVSLNLAEVVSNNKEAENEIERNLPITLKDSVGPNYEATLSVRVNFVEVRGCPDRTRSVRNPIDHDDKEGILIRVLKDLTSFRKKNRAKGNPNNPIQNNEMISSNSAPVESGGVYDSEKRSSAATVAVEEAGVTGSYPIPVEENQMERDRNQGALSWKKRRLWLRLSFRNSKRKVEPYVEKTCSTVNDVVTCHREDDDKEWESKSSSSMALPANSLIEAKAAEFSEETDSQFKEGRWERREIVSRDGKVKLNTNVFFGSFDQRSEKAGGESACTAIVSVITHWLHLNQGSMPTRSDLDSLIMEGSSEWQKLCNNHCYSNAFPNKHFDLETVVEANVRPIVVSSEKSFVGFFSPEKFKCLNEAMSFEQIWNEITNRKNDLHWEPRIYIVSWNDHFFVLKLDEDTCYIVDSLGERLFEGCNQSYMLRFDSSSSMVFENNEKLGEEEDGVEAELLICEGKDCCKEFFERFLAAITIEELEEEQKKLMSCDFTPHQRLQIDFNFSSLAHAASSTNSTYSLFSDEDNSFFSSSPF